MARGQEFNEECQLLATAGFDTGFEPVTFDLGPGHFVEWTLRGANVTYEGRTTRQSIPLAEPGARFLPLQDTELATGPTRSLTRHFVEVFLWSPAWKSGQWTGQWNLQWHVFEIVRDEIVPIDTPQPLLTIDGDAPPRADAFDVHDYAVVRVDDRGNSEWAVLKGPHTEKRAIETDAERRETRDVASARDAALKRVDWNRRSDVKRLPAMTVVDSDGCGYFQLVGWTADRDEASGRAGQGHVHRSSKASRGDRSDLRRAVGELHGFSKLRIRRPVSTCFQVQLLPALTLGPHTVPL